jgi:hypothetical protein
MALYYDLPVYRDTYRLILKIFECTKDFSKEYKYTLGQDMKRDALQLVRSMELLTNFDNPNGKRMVFIFYKEIVK